MELASINRLLHRQRPHYIGLRHNLRKCSRLNLGIRWRNRTSLPFPPSSLWSSLEDSRREHRTLLNFIIYDTVLLSKKQYLASSHYRSNIANTLRAMPYINYILFLCAHNPSKGHNFLTTLRTLY